MEQLHMPENRSTILVVDDTPDNLMLLNGLLREKYRVKVANHGEVALRLVLADPRPDLILLDVMMPDMNGYEVCTKLKANHETEDIPVIFLTAKTAIEDEEEGFSVGGADYISKPIIPSILLARVQTQLALKAAQVFLKNQNQYLEHLVQERTRELAHLQQATILAMASLAETRDNETGKHLRRTQHFVALLALELSDDPRYSDELTPANIQWLYKSAPMHDIGKVGVPDHILLKPGKLTDEEFNLMKMHTVYGRDVITSVESYLGTKEDKFLHYAREIAYSHQEKWDGSGYPQGLKGEEIPLSARLMAVADVYDALVSRRVYKPAFSHDEAMNIIVKGGGSHFDPAVVGALLRIQFSFPDISVLFADDESEPHH
ncbi:HD-GYP domain-containing protein [Iodobacter fluviatilis]|uniref:Cyclic di-GMP phosphodiesterase response regulator RpfG n=1 Tax=Iodobacter fluviatilis TaxID=537 RepID=A0A377SVF1_9NEIS|nr:two-component system response regulator [Iodobacter fluviatilis]TCU81364.1 putative two-component system response regulator [Iodobacter fluviatilis]STR46032.1 Cyclic di-GMP phosphodiesterase response regulator RpfG [Iodobacter fluviatilis]